jgi:hypothetical protein
LPSFMIMPSIRRKNTSLFTVLLYPYSNRKQLSALSGAKSPTWSVGTSKNRTPSNMIWSWLRQLIFPNPSWIMDRLLVPPEPTEEAFK